MQHNWHETPQPRPYYQPRTPSAYSRQRRPGYPPLFPSALPPTPPARLPVMQTNETRGGMGSVLSSLVGQAGASGGGIASSGLNFTSMLVNAQKAIQTAQTVLPMIQQFGPLVKNAPSLLNSLKGFQETAETKKKDDETNLKGEELNEEKKQDMDNGDNSTVAQTEIPDKSSRTVTSGTHRSDSDEHKQKLVVSEPKAEEKDVPANQKKKLSVHHDAEAAPVTRPSMPRLYI